MNDAKKKELADMIIRFISEHADKKTKDDMPVMVGTLNRVVGINGFVKAQPGDPVFEYRDRYVIYLVSVDGKQTVSIPYYKHNFKDSINFQNGL